MKFNILISIFFLTLFTHKCLAQNEPVVRCLYANAELMYTCFLHVYNPDGFNNFTEVTGIHLTGKTDADVEYIYGVGTINSINFPEIICNTFVNVKKLELIKNPKIDNIDAYSFKGCNQATYLNLMDDKITHVEPDLFENLESLEELNLGFNGLVDLPAGLLSPLVNLRSLTMYTNELVVIHSNIFGVHVNLTYIYLSRNKIEAIGPAILDNTAVSTLLLSGNVCINKNFVDESKEVMREALKLCFDNFDLIDTVTPEPCNSENIEQRVCDMEDGTRRFIENITNEINALKSAIESLWKAIEELPNNS